MFGGSQSRLHEVARRLTWCCAVGLILCAAGARAGDITITSSSAEFPLTDAEVTMTLVVANHGSESRQLRMRPPYVARLDEMRRVFEPLRDVESLRVQMDQLDVTLAPGQQQELEVRLLRQGIMQAGRYKLLFVAQDAQTGERVSSGAIFVIIPPSIVLDQPDVVALDAIGDANHVTATLRFNVRANVRTFRVSVVAGDLHCRREDGSDYRLTLDEAKGTQVISRGQLRPNSLQLAFTSAEAESDGTAHCSEWAELAAPGDESLLEDLYVQLRWTNDRRQPLPAGEYQGEVRLVLVPVPDP
jgi:hypothetical protein